VTGRVRSRAGLRWKGVRRGKGIRAWVEFEIAEYVVMKMVESRFVDS